MVSSMQGRALTGLVSLLCLQHLQEPGTCQGLMLFILSGQVDGLSLLVLSVIHLCSLSLEGADRTDFGGWNEPFGVVSTKTEEIVLQPTVSYF